MFLTPPRAPFPAYTWLAEAGWVFAVHSAQLWTNPAGAGARLTALWMEKQQAFAEGAMKAGVAAMNGAPPDVLMEAALAPTRRCVRANAGRIRKDMAGRS